MSHWLEGATSSRPVATYRPGSRGLLVAATSEPENVFIHGVFRSRAIGKAYGPALIVNECLPRTHMIMRLRSVAQRYVSRPQQAGNARPGTNAMIRVPIVGRTSWLIASDARAVFSNIRPAAGRPARAPANHQTLRLSSSITRRICIVCNVYNFWRGSECVQLTQSE